MNPLIEEIFACLFYLDRREISLKIDNLSMNLIG